MPMPAAERVIADRSGKGSGARVVEAGFVTALIATEYGANAATSWRITRQFRHRAQPSKPMDAVDHHIIAELQRDGRLSNVELAERVGLSPAPCLRRVRRLESEGVIRGYVARIDPRAVGRSFEVLVNVDLTRKDRATFEAFED